MQNLLYLQTESSSVDSAVIGCALVEGGTSIELGNGTATWPFSSVGDAIRAGWRVISFPQPTQTRDLGGIGCEFILERIQ